MAQAQAQELLEQLLRAVLVHQRIVTYKKRFYHLGSFLLALQPNNQNVSVQRQPSQAVFHEYPMTSHLQGVNAQRLILQHDQA